MQFEAPLVPGVGSYLQQYYKIVRILTVPLLVLMVFLFAGLWEANVATWILVLGIAMPINFLLAHYFLSKGIAQWDKNRRNAHKLIFVRDELIIYREGRPVDYYCLDELQSLKLIYSGYDRAFFSTNKHFHGGNNQVHFRHKGKIIEYRFRLLSRKHAAAFKETLMYWYDIGLKFEEYNTSSGLPIKSYLLTIE